MKKALITGITGQDGRYLFENVACDLCNGSETKPFRRMKDHLYGVPGTFAIVECSSCGLLYTNPRPKLELTDDLYRKYYGEFDATVKSDGGSLRDSLKRNLLLRRSYHLLFGQYLSEVLSKARDRVLDVGCGSGSLLEEMVQLGCEGYGVEPNPKAVQACIKKGLNVRCGVLDDMEYPDNFFDTIILWHVIEHLSSPKKTLKNIYRILSPGGHVFIYCPNAKSYMKFFFREFWAGWHLPFHYYHFTPETMRKLVSSTPFRILRMRPLTSDIVFHRSLRTLVSNKNKCLQRIHDTVFFKLLLVRSLLALLFRVLDVALPGRGEFLQIELGKERQS